MGSRTMKVVAMLAAPVFLAIAFACGYVFGATERPEFLATLVAIQAEEATSTPTVTPLPTNTPTPEVLSLPYSLAVGGLRITIVAVTPAEQEHGFLSEGYRQWTVNFSYENLLNTDWEAPDTGCIGLVDEFKLETDQGNIYKPKYTGGESLCDSLKPKATLLRDELYIFEIRQEERPVRLLGYRGLSGYWGYKEGQLVYAFELPEQ